MRVEHQVGSLLVLVIFIVLGLAGQRILASDIVPCYFLGEWLFFFQGSQLEFQFLVLDEKFFFRPKFDMMLLLPRFNLDVKGLLLINLVVYPAPSDAKVRL